MIIQEHEDAVNHPSHYTYGTIECIDFLDSCGYGDDYCIAAAIKYLCRYKHKTNPIEDLKKAVWYINHAIDKYTDGTYKLEEKKGE